MTAGTRRNGRVPYYVPSFQIEGVKVQYVERTASTQIRMVYLAVILL